MENKIDITKLKAQDFMNELPEMVRSLEAVRSGSQDKKPVEVTFGELVTGKWGISEDELFEKMGINPKVDTMQNIFTMPQQNVRWIVPEIIRAAITLGMRQAPFYPNIIASDQPSLRFSIIKVVPSSFDFGTISMLFETLSKSLSVSKSFQLIEILIEESLLAV